MQLAVASLFSPYFALLMLVASAAVVAMALALAPRLQTWSRAARQANAALFTRVQETFQGIQAIKAYGFEDANYGRFRSESTAALDTAFTLRRDFAVLKAAVSYLPALLVFATDYTATQFVLAEGAVFGASLLVLFGMSVTQWTVAVHQARRSRIDAFALHFEELARVWCFAQDMAVGLDRAFWLLAQRPEVSDPDEPVPFPAVLEGVRFTGVQGLVMTERYHDRLDVRTTLATGDVIALFRRALGYLWPQWRLFAARAGLMVLIYALGLPLPWFLKILIDHGVMQQPIPPGGEGLLYPFFMTGFLDSGAGLDPLAVTLYALTTLAVVFLFVGYSGNTMLEANLAEGADVATRSENKISAGFSAAHGLVGLLDLCLAIRLSQRITHHVRGELFSRLSRQPLTSANLQRSGDAIFRVRRTVDRGDLLRADPESACHGGEAGVFLNGPRNRAGSDVSPRDTATGPRSAIATLRRCWIPLSGRAQGSRGRELRGRCRPDSGNRRPERRRQDDARPDDPQVPESHRRPDHVEWRRHRGTGHDGPAARGRLRLPGTPTAD